MENITCNHPIFSSPEYKRDRIPFFMLEAIKKTAKVLLSDGESWVICSSLVPHLAAWVWTADGIGGEQIGRLREELCGIFTDEYKPSITAKPEIAEELARDYGEPYIKMLMNVYTCLFVITPREIDGEIRKAVADDAESIALFIRNFEAECFDNKAFSVEKSLKAANKIIEIPWSFVVSCDGRPVALAKNALTIEGFTSVNSVYTLPEYRRRGYAAALTAHICKLIIESGKIPLLYADAANPASNKAYLNVGFVCGGQVLNYEFRG